MRRIFRLVLFASCVSAGCVPVVDNGDDLDAIEGADSAEPTIATYLKRIPCTTEPIRPLSQQLIDELLCAHPKAVEEITPRANLSFSDDSVLPYLDPLAAASLRALADQGAIVVTSTTRTVAQQYLLAQWRAGRKCGIPAAADPGTSQHEAGRAVDVHLTSTLAKRLIAAGWARETGEDPIHFVYAAPSTDLTRSIEAFQRLWNYNRPEDQIPQSGVLDALTIKKLRLAPALGFANGASCSAPTAVALGNEEDAPLLE